MTASNLRLRCHPHIPRCFPLKDSGDKPGSATLELRERGGWRLLVNTTQDKSGSLLECVDAKFMDMERGSAACRLLTMKCTDINSR